MHIVEMYEPPWTKITLNNCFLGQLFHKTKVLGRSVSLSNVPWATGSTPAWRKEKTKGRVQQYYGKFH